MYILFYWRYELVYHSLWEHFFFFYLTKDTYSHALVKQKTHILCKWHPSWVRLRTISFPWIQPERQHPLAAWEEARLTVTLRSATGNTPTSNLCANACKLLSLLYVYWSSCHEITFLYQVRAPTERYCMWFLFIQRFVILHAFQMNLLSLIAAF